MCTRQQWKKRIAMATFAVAITLCLAFAANAQEVDNFTFEQLNFLDQDGVVKAADSDWGRVSFDIYPADDGVVGYLNISATIEGNTGWIVRNYPVLPDEFIDPGRFALHFDFNELLVSSGTDVNSLAYIDEVTSTIQVSGPVGEMTTAPIHDVDVRRFGSLIPDGDNDYDGPSELVPPYYTSEVDKSQLRKYKGIPSVQEGVNECASGSTARSLKWLSDKHNLGLGSVDAIQDELAQAKYMNKGVTDEEQVKAKKRYIEDKNLPLEVHYWYSKTIYPNGMNTPDIDSANSTQIDLVDFLWDEMGKGQDIEITIKWAEGGGHSVTLVGIDKKNKTLEYRDDANQGDDTLGDVAYNETSLVPLGAGEYGFDSYGDRIKTALVESPRKLAEVTATPETATVGTPATITVKNTGLNTIRITIMGVRRPTGENDIRDGLAIDLEPGESVARDYPEFWSMHCPYPNVDKPGTYTVNVVWDETFTTTSFVRTQPSRIPTVSQWGLIIMALVLLAAGATVIIWRKRRAAA